MSVPTANGPFIGCVHSGARGSAIMIYLDNAATSFPKAPRVYEQLRSYLERYGGCPGRGSYPMAREAEAVIDAARAVLAELFAVSDPRRIVFTLNATDALNMAIKGCLSPGDHVVTTVMEHNSVMRPLNALERRGMITVTRVGASRQGLIDPDDIRRAITDSTRLVVVVHASNVTGSLQPIADIGRIVREADRLLLVDAAQTAGCVPIDVEEACIDLLAFPGHKALLGPPGTGGLYVGPRARIRPWREGGTGVLSELPLQPSELPLRLEAGSPNTVGVAGLRESVQFILQYGVGWIRSHELMLTTKLLEGLLDDPRFVVHGPLTREERVAVVSLSVNGCAAEEVGTRLNDIGGIAVRTGLHCAPGAHQAVGTFPAGSVRISPGYFTKATEINLCLEALHEAADTLVHKRTCQPCA